MALESKYLKDQKFDSGQHEYVYDKLIETLVWFYDIKAKTWSQAPSLCDPRSKTAGCAMGDKIFLFGGMTLHGPYESSVMGYEVLNLTDDEPSWVKVEDWKF